MLKQLKCFFKQRLIFLSMNIVALTSAQLGYFLDMFNTEQLTGKEIFDFSSLKIKRVLYNGIQTAVLSGPIISHIEFDESYSSTFQYWRVSNIGSPSSYEPMPYVLGRSQTFCEFYNSDEMIMPGILTASNLPPKGGCPFPKGNYTIRNYTGKTNVNKDMFSNGRYYLEFRMYQQSEVKFLWRLYFIMIKY